MRRSFIIAAFLTVASSRLAAQAVPCEAPDGGYRQCRIGAFGTIRLVRELSQNLCIEGITWGTQSTGVVWVERGCRAIFTVDRPAEPKVGGYHRPVIRTISCESKEDARVQCAADTRYGVALVKMLGDARCILEKTWGFDDSGVWVTSGCRAQFALGGFRLAPDEIPAGALKITCVSTTDVPAHCTTVSLRGVGLTKQLSETDCVLNRNWGYVDDGVWVTDGCSAEFVVLR
jgi:hypothetical protein